MAKSLSAKKGRRSPTTRRRSSRAKNGSARDDAVRLLKADHREVERLFGEFQRTRSDERRTEIAAQICQALRAHTTIEEEIFYPAFLEATEDTALHHEAEIEHEGAKHLIEEIESAGPSDDHFEARVTVLAEMIKHHVKEEEQRGGMFSKAQHSDMDLAELGRRMNERKLELMGEDSAGLEGALSSRRPLSARGSTRRTTAAIRR